jgi:hypothetical protein
MLIAVVALVSAPGAVRASVSIAVSWENLLQASTVAAVMTPVEARSAWENGRIYTYSHVRVAREIAGTIPSGDDVWVRTMGGIVGNTGQRVEGEPQLVVGQPSLLFLQPGPNGFFHITARAQGQFPVVAASAERPAYVVRSAAVGALVPRQPSAAVPTLLAAEALHGRTVDDAAFAIASAWGRTHVR